MSREQKNRRAGEQKKWRQSYSLPVFFPSRLSKSPH
jgi:hypothetical protein